MNPAARAFRLGLDRGRILFVGNIKRVDTLVTYVFWYGLPIVGMVLLRDEAIAGVPGSLAMMFLPGVLTMLIVVATSTPAFYLSTEREDGTLLRAKAVPYGMIGYVTGMIVFACLDAFVGVAAALIAGLLLLPGIEIALPIGGLVFVVVVLLGLTATLPFGIIAGSLVRNPRLVAGLSMAVIVGLSIVSGIFGPLQMFEGWVQLIAQALPIYWIGVGMRFVFLPETAVLAEIGQTWRLAEMVLVLGAWSVVGFLLSPIVLRRMAQRESGSTMESRRLAAMQRLG